MWSWVVSKLASPLGVVVEDTGEPAVDESDGECRARREIPALVALELAEVKLELACVGGSRGEWVVRADSELVVMGAGPRRGACCCCCC